MPRARCRDGHRRRPNRPQRSVVPHYYHIFPEVRSRIAYPRVAPIFAPQNRRSEIRRHKNICVLLGVPRFCSALPEICGSAGLRPPPSAPKRAKPPAHVAPRRAQTSLATPPSQSRPPAPKLQRLVVQTPEHAHAAPARTIAFNCAFGRSAPIIHARMAPIAAGIAHRNVISKDNPADGCRESIVVNEAHGQAYLSDKTWLIRRCA